MKQIETNLTEEDIGQRFDSTIASKVDISRTLLSKYIKNGNVLFNDTAIINPSQKIRYTGHIVINAKTEVVETHLVPENIPLNIVFEDEHMIVINKAAGMVCHPAPGNHSKTLVNALLQYCRENLSNENGTNRPGIIHRLDKDTSGLMITAKTNEFHKKMAQYFSLENGKKIIKKYLCWTFGIPKQRNSQINTFLKRDRRDRQKYTVDQHDGKFSITKYNVLEIAYITSTKALSLIECELLTGRTHQIRVHMRHIGCPIVGDPTYGYGKVSQLYPDMVKTFPRTALHSHHLEFKHPITGENMLFQAELPQDLHDLNHVCFSKK